VHIKFVDWIPGICSALGMLVINSIEKSRLSADSFSYSGTSVAWKARLVLFLGFALMAGGLAGSVVCFPSHRPTQFSLNLFFFFLLLLIIKRMLTSVNYIDRSCPQIRRSRIPFSDTLLWRCQRHCQWAYNVKVSGENHLSLRIL
jgi:hypothetical protein